MCTADLEGHSVLELIQKHLQLAHTDDEVWQAELVLHIPTQRPKLETLLHNKQAVVEIIYTQTSLLKRLQARDLLRQHVKPNLANFPTPV